MNVVNTLRHSLTSETRCSAPLMAPSSTQSPFFLRAFHEAEKHITFKTASHEWGTERINSIRQISMYNYDQSNNVIAFFP